MSFQSRQRCSKFILVFYVDPDDLLPELVRTYVVFLKARRENRMIKASNSGLRSSTRALFVTLQSPTQENVGKSTLLKVVAGGAGAWLKRPTIQIKTLGTLTRRCGLPA